jgi:hypothetical protein
MNNGLLSFAFVPAVVAAFLAGSPVFAQSEQPADAFRPFVAVVTASDVYVRSGAAESYYPVGKVHTGELVRVVGEKFNWARVATTGPTFADHSRFFGYVVYPATQPGRFRLEDGGRAGVTLGRTDILAPNFVARLNPADSWKPLVRLGPDERLVVLETFTSGNNTVHKVVLPENGETWISRSFLRPATAEEQAAWSTPRSVRAEPAAPQPAQPQQGPHPAPVTAPQVTPPAAQQPAPVSEPTPARAALPTEPPVEQTPLGRDQTPSPRPAPANPEPSPAAASAPPAPAPDANSDPAPARMPLMETPTLPMGGTSASAAPSTSAPEKGAAPPPSLAKIHAATLEDLEAAYRALRAEPLGSAEVEPLRRMYIEFAAKPGADRNERRFAESRAEQLRIWGELQERQAEITRIRARARTATERTTSAREAILAAADYTAVGRLVASTIYDGERLPRLLRLEDTGTNRTVAYIEPDAKIDLFPMIGHLIGVVGEREYDGSLRLNIITPQRVDILAAAAAATD